MWIHILVSIDVTARTPLHLARLLNEFKFKWLLGGIGGWGIIWLKKASLNNI